MNVSVQTTKTFSHCYHECPHFVLDGGPGPVMMCTHPNAVSPYIISHPDCDTGFPKDCPLSVKNNEEVKILLVNDEVEKFNSRIRGLIQDDKSREFFNLVISEIIDYFNRYKEFILDSNDLDVEDKEKDKGI